MKQRDNDSKTTLTKHKKMGRFTNKIAKMKRNLYVRFEVI